MGKNSRHALIGKFVDISGDDDCFISGPGTYKPPTNTFTEVGGLSPSPRPGAPEPFHALPSDFARTTLHYSPSTRFPVVPKISPRLRFCPEVPMTAGARIAKDLNETRETLFSGNLKRSNEERRPCCRNRRPERSRPARSWVVISDLRGELSSSNFCLCQHRIALIRRAVST